MHTLSGWHFAPALLAGIFVSVPGCSSSEPVSKESNGGNLAASGSGTNSNAKVGSLLSTAEVREILSVQSRGIGHLENREWVPAEAALTQLSERLPGSIDTAKNLAIGRILSLLDNESPFSLSKNPQAFADMVQKAHAAVDAFEKLTTSNEDKAFVALLSGKLAVVEDSPMNPHIAEGLEQLRKATTLAPERAEYWYALASALSGHRD